MRYYLIRVTNTKNEVVDYKGYTDLKSAKLFIKTRYTRCPKHFYKEDPAICCCLTYSLYDIKEKLLDKKEM